MKYLERSFNSRPATDSYRGNYAATFGEAAKPCGWCGGTGLVDAGPNGEYDYHEVDGVIEPFEGRRYEPCPRGCEAGK